MNILDYIYEVDNLFVKTYVLKQDRTGLYIENFRNYHYPFLGDMMIYKLSCRGYLEMNEAYQKYGVDYFDRREKVKKIKKKK